MSSDYWLDDGPAPEPPDASAYAADSALGVQFQRGDEVELGVDLARSLGSPVDVTSDEGKAWQYRRSEGVWHAWDDELLAQRAMGYAGRYIVGGKEPRPVMLSAGNVKGIVRMCKTHLHSPGFLAGAPFGAPFVGAFARIDGNAVIVEPTTREHRIRADHVPPFRLPTDGARPETLDRLIAETWNGCADLDDRTRYFWEWLGAALCGIATRYKDSPLLVGQKDTGKSALLHSIACVFPLSARRSTTLHDMASEYHRARMAGGRINFVNELPARELMDGEAAKAILSGEPVSCRHPAEKAYEWVPRCACAFAANDLPPSPDKALMDRLVVLDCVNVVPRERQDRHLIDKLTAEAPHIAAAALAALPALLDRGYLVRPGSAAVAAAEWALESDAVSAWASDINLRADDIGSIGASDLYTVYRDWCKANGHATVSATKLGKRLVRLGFQRYKSSDMRWRVRHDAPAPSGNSGRDWYGQ